MKKPQPIILGKLTSKLSGPSEIAKRFFEDAQDTFETCLSKYDKKDPEIFRPELLKFEQSHSVKLLRMTRHPLGLFFEAEGNIYHIAITNKDYKYKKIPKADYLKSTRNLKPQ